MDLTFPTTARDLAAFLGASLIGDADAPVEGLSALTETREGYLSFCAHKKWVPTLLSLEGGVLLSTSEWVQSDSPLTYLVVENPQAAFARVARKLTAKPVGGRISIRAEIDPSAKLGEHVTIGAFAVIGANAVVGRGSVIEAHAFVGEKVEIGENSFVGSHVSLLERVRVGNRVRIYAGTVIGSEGFGLIQNKGDGNYVEMPQVGTVVLEDDVRVGAKCTIDRATLGETRIGQGSKLDDQVHVGHNVRIGKNCVLCGQVGIAGSATLEDEVILGGQVGVSDHVTIGKGARVGAQSGVAKDLAGGQDYFMSPAIPMMDALRISKHLRRLPDLAKRIKEIESSLEKGSTP